MQKKQQTNIMLGLILRLESNSKPSATQSCSTYFADALIAEAEADKDIVSIHAAMGDGTGMNLYQRRFPTRCFDVGIAEQNAVLLLQAWQLKALSLFVQFTHHSCRGLMTRWCMMWICRIEASLLRLEEVGY